MWFSSFDPFAGELIPCILIWLNTVARWDDVERPPELLESRSVESLSIGYIGDEW